MGSTSRAAWTQLHGRGTGRREPLGVLDSGLRPGTLTCAAEGPEFHASRGLDIGLLAFWKDEAENMENAYFRVCEGSCDAFRVQSCF